MKISIIVPFYNAEKTIERCIESLLKQNNVDLEIVLVNDSSNDESFILCSKYAKQDNRIILTNSDNQGVSAARNKGLECCTGDIVGFCDADDCYEDNVLVKVLEAFVFEPQINMVVTGFNICYENGYVESRLTHKINKNNFFSKILNDSNTMGAVWNKFFKYEILANERFNEGISLCEDTLFLTQLLMRTGSLQIKKVPLITYNYYQNSESVTNNVDMLFDENNYLLYFKFIDLILEQFTLGDYEKKQIGCARARLAYNTLNNFDLNLDRKNKLILEIKTNLASFIQCGFVVGKKNYMMMVFKMVCMR